MARHLHITGLVQGVGYRAAFARKADALALSGWVRNRFDGSVEALISGTPEALDEMAEWAKIGPPGARVSVVSVTETSEPNIARKLFEIRPTS